MRHKSLKWLMFAVSFPVVIVSAQNLDKKWAGTIENKNGIIIIENSGQPISDENILSLHEEISIGKAEGSDEYLFSRIDGFDIDPDGNFYIIDGASTQIRIFNREGRFLKTIGRKGQGPGEFQRPYFVQISPSGELLVFDVLTSRLFHFSSAGIFLKQTYYSLARGFNPNKVDAKGNLIGIKILAPDPIGGKELKIIDAEGKLSLEIAKEESDWTKKEKRELDIGKPRLCFAVSETGQIYWSHPDQYEITVVDSTGKTSKIIRNRSKRIEISEEDKVLFEKNYTDMLKRGWKLIFHDHYPFFEDISIDDQDRLFIKTYEKVKGTQNRFVYDVYDCEGKYLAKIPIPANLNSNSVWKKNKLYTLETDPEGFEKITRYRVEWKEK